MLSSLNGHLGREWRMVDHYYQHIFWKQWDKNSKSQKVETKALWPRVKQCWLLLTTSSMRRICCGEKLTKKYKDIWGGGWSRVWIVVKIVMCFTCVGNVLHRLYTCVGNVSLYCMGCLRPLCDLLLVAVIRLKSVPLSLSWHCNVGLSKRLVPRDG